MRRWVDNDGDEWPITNRVCEVCGLPTSHFAIHPLCEPNDNDETRG